MFKFSELTAAGVSRQFRFSRQLRLLFGMLFSLRNQCFSSFQTDFVEPPFSLSSPPPPTIVSFKNPPFCINLKGLRWGGGRWPPRSYRPHSRHEIKKERSCVRVFLPCFVWKSLSVTFNCMFQLYACIPLICKIMGICALPLCFSLSCKAALWSRKRSVSSYYYSYYYYYNIIIIIVAAFQRLVQPKNEQQRKWNYCN